LRLHWNAREKGEEEEEEESFSRLANLSHLKKD
jgi:hypothetical protein